VSREKTLDKIDELTGGLDSGTRWEVQKVLAEAIPQVSRIESTGCIGCPFVGIDEDDHSKVMCWADVGHGYQEIRMAGDLPPAWCPLREGGVLVTLKTPSDKENSE